MIQNDLVFLRPCRYQNNIKGAHMNKTSILVFLLTTILILLIGCSSTSPDTSDGMASDEADEDEAGIPQEEVYMLQQSTPLSFNVTTTSLKTTGFLLPDFTCEGAEFGKSKVSDISPHIGWEEVPSDTKSIAIVAEDLDLAGAVASHWIVWGLPSDTRELPEGVSGSSNLPTGATEGLNAYGQPGYKGPCPPPKVIYSAGCRNTGYVSNPYLWTVYAVGKEIILTPDTTRDDLLRAIEGNVLASGSLDVKYISKKTLYPICRQY